MSNSWYNEHKDDFFRKYTDEQLIADINNFINGHGDLSKTLEHFLVSVFIKVQRVKALYLHMMLYRTMI